MLLLALLDPVEIMTQRAAIRRVVIEEINADSRQETLLAVDSPDQKTRCVAYAKIERTIKLVRPMLERLELPFLLQPLDQVPPHRAHQGGGEVAKVLLPDERIRHAGGALLLDHRRVDRLGVVDGQELVEPARSRLRRLVDLVEVVLAPRRGDERSPALVLRQDGA